MTSHTAEGESAESKAGKKKKKPVAKEEKEKEKPLSAVAKAIKAKIDAQRAEEDRKRVCDTTFSCLLSHQSR